MQALIRLVLWMTRHTIFKIRVAGQEHAPRGGPALLAANHVTYADGFLIGACVRPLIRFMAWQPLYRVTFVNWGLRAIKAIPVGTEGPREVLQTILRARQDLVEGKVVCIF